MRSEHRSDLAGGESTQHLVPCRARHAPGEKCMMYAEPPADPREAAPMLLGEQFSRRHHGRLMPTFNCAEHRPKRDERLAAADVAHQHAIHLVRPRKISTDFLD